MSFTQGIFQPFEALLPGPQADIPVLLEKINKEAKTLESKKATNDRKRTGNSCKLGPGEEKGYGH